MADTAGVRRGGVRAAVPGEPSQGRVGGALESTCCRRRLLQVESARSTVRLHGPRVHTLATIAGRAGFDTVRSVRTRTSSAWLYRPCDVDGEVRRRAVQRTGPIVRGGLLVLQRIDRVPWGVCGGKARGRGRPETCVAGAAPEVKVHAKAWSNRFPSGGGGTGLWSRRL